MYQDNIYFLTHYTEINIHWKGNYLEMSSEPSITIQSFRQHGDTCMIKVIITNGSSRHMDRGYADAPSPPPGELRLNPISKLTKKQALDALANKHSDPILEKKRFVPIYEDNEEFWVSCASNQTVDGCLLRLALSLVSSAFQGCGAACNRNCNVSFNSICLHVQALTDLQLFTMTSQRAFLPTIELFGITIPCTFIMHICWP